MKEGTQDGQFGQTSEVFDRAVRVREMRMLLEQEIWRGTLGVVHAMFEEEVQAQCGKPFSRKEEGQCYRGGSEKRAAILLNGQQVRVTRPRIRGSAGEAPLVSYRALRDRDVFADDLKEALVRGISTRDYRGTVRTFEGALGLSRDLVSRAFIRASEKDLEFLNRRDLSGYRFVALFLDGIEFQRVHLIVAMGLTEKGEKVILGLKKGSTENERLCVDLLHSIDERGFQREGEFLAVIDGGKGIHSALTKRWEDRVWIQRCLVHKKRNVRDYLPKSLWAEAKRRMNAAWNLVDYDMAKAELERVVSWLDSICPPAAESLREGMEETLTLHRLRVPTALRKTLATTNPLESGFSIVRHVGARVKHWRKGEDQVERWAAAGLREAERRMRRVRGYREIAKLQEAFQNMGK